MRARLSKIVRNLDGDVNRLLIVQHQQKQQSHRDLNDPRQRASWWADVSVIRDDRVRDWRPFRAVVVYVHAVARRGDSNVREKPSLPVSGVEGSDDFGEIQPSRGRVEFEGGGNEQRSEKSPGFVAVSSTLEPPVGSVVVALFRPPINGQPHLEGCLRIYEPLCMSLPPPSAADLSLLCTLFERCPSNHHEVPPEKMNL